MPYESINWESAAIDEYAYHRAVEGRLLPLPPDVIRTVEALDAEDVVARAAEAIIEAHTIRKYDRPKGWKSADRIVTEFVRDRDALRAWGALLDAAIHRAKSSPRYWGVDDPTTHSYCSYCRRALPIEEFSRCQFVCDSCEGGRRER